MPQLVRSNTVQSVNSAEPVAPTNELTKEVPKLIFSVVCLLFFGACNNVGGSMISYDMPTYVSFLLWGTTLLITLLFLVLSYCAGQQPFSAENLSWSQQRHFLVLGLLCAGNGLTFQYSAAWVSGGLGQVLLNLALVQVPFVELLMIRRHRPSREWLGVAVVLTGVLVGAGNVLPTIGNTPEGAPSEQSNAWYWVVAFIASTTFTALQQVRQDMSFGDNVELLPCLFWYNAYALLIYLLTCPLDAVAYLNGTTQAGTFTGALANQWDALRCFFGQPDPAAVLDGSCQPGATLWVMVFVVGYVGLFFANAALISDYGVLFPNVVGSLIQLLSVLIFNLQFIVGKHVNPFSWWPIGGCAIIVVGILLQGWPTKVEQEGENRVLATETREALGYRAVGSKGDRDSFGDESDAPDAGMNPNEPARRLSALSGIDPRTGAAVGIPIDELLVGDADASRRMSRGVVGGMAVDDPGAAGEPAVAGSLHSASGIGLFQQLFGSREPSATRLDLNESLLPAAASHRASERCPPGAVAGGRTSPRPDGRGAVLTVSSGGGAHHGAPEESPWLSGTRRVRPEIAGEDAEAAAAAWPSPQPARRH